MNDLRSVVEIHDPEIDHVELLQRVQTRIATRRQEAQSRGQDYDHLTDERGLLHGVRLLPGRVYQNLQYVSENSDDLWVSVNVRDERLPLLNRLWMGIKQAFHLLVVFYVNQLAGRQVAFNTAAWSLFVDLVKTLEEQEEQLATLEAEIARLKARSDGQDHVGEVGNAERPAGGDQRTI
jgi:hypothetical protein